MSKKNSRRQKHSNFLFPLIVLGVIILGTILWYSLPHPTPIGINVVGSADGTATLTLTPAEITSTPNTESTLTLLLDGGESHVTGAQIEINYNTSQVDTPQVTLGSFLSVILSEVKIENGKITFTLAAPPTSGGITGSGLLATIKIKPLIPGTSSLDFTANTVVTATEFATNTLQSAASATLVVTVPASAEPSVEPSAEPSSPASPAKPAKPTGLRSNCYEGGSKITLRWDAVSGASSYKVRLDQKDGDDYQSIDDIDNTEYNLSLSPDQKYAWWVHSNQNGVDSEEAKVDEVICIKTVSTPTPTPSPTPKPTVKPTVKPSVKASPTQTPKPTTTISAAFVSPSPGIAESLNDIFAGAMPSPTPTPQPSTNIFARIWLGWRAIFQKIGETLFK
ncbi:MAG: cohesin domain-containing protein [bacterium]